MNGLEMQLLAKGTEWSDWDVIDNIYQFDGCYLDTHICYALGLDTNVQYTLFLCVEGSWFQVSDSETGKTLGTGSLQIAPTNMKKAVDNP